MSTCYDLTLASYLLTILIEDLSEEGEGKSASAKGPLKLKTLTSMGVQQKNQALPTWEEWQGVLSAVGGI